MKFYRVRALVPYPHDVAEFDTALEAAQWIQERSERPWEYEIEVVRSAQ